MEDKNFPPFPPLPDLQNYINRSESSPQENSVSSSIPPSHNTLALNSIITYIDGLDRSVRPRMEEYEKKQKELEEIILRERIIELATQRLLSVNFIFAILLPFFIVIIFLYILL